MPGYWNAHSDRDWEDQGEPNEDGSEIEYNPAEECGRWINGRLMPIYDCLSAGTEFCDFECPLRRR